MKYSKEQIMGAFKKLSETDQQLFMAVETAESIWAVAKKYNLSNTQELDLVDLTTFVMLKLDPLKDFIENITKTLQVEAGVAVSIKDDLVSAVIGRFESFNAPTISIISPFVSQKTPSNSFLTSQTENGIRNRIDNEIMSSESAGTETSEPNAQEEEKLLPDHEAMEREGGMHLHSQSIMPSQTATKSGYRFGGSRTLKPNQPVQAAPVQTSQPTSAPAPSRPLMQPQQPQQSPKPSFSSIIDQKLSRIVRSSNTGETKPGYKGSDPYREPLE